MFMRLMRLALAAFVLVFLLPLGAHALMWMGHGHPRSWSGADWTSSSLLPAPVADSPAIIHIYAARTGRWKGAVAHHTWLVVKEAGAVPYERYDKVGWGTPVRRDGWAPDGRWYGNMPELVAAIEGEAAEALLPAVRAAIADYPFRERGSYRVWPGPNSNSFVAHVVARVPQLGVALPPTALGKDYHVEMIYAGLAPSGTGFQVALGGLFGITVAWVEGLEINLFGLVAGLDLRQPALKLPGFGRLALV
ncbi:DUF3750 domain-containing protein [Chelatococcus daeguensis]|nr:DUF3750 domain-containing protein [Chelatococcus daeguensis]